MLVKHGCYFIKEFANRVDLLAISDRGNMNNWFRTTLKKYPVKKRGRILTKRII